MSCSCGWREGTPRPRPLEWPRSRELAIPRIERSVVIDRSVPDVFSYMDDIDRERDWQPNLREASQEPRGPVGVGTLKRYTSIFLKKQIQNVYRVTVYDLYVRVVYESTPESAIHATAEIRWDAVGISFHPSQVWRMQ